MPLYHRDVYIPPRMRVPEFTFSPIYTDHAYDEAQADRHGVIKLPLIVSLTRSGLIEVETDSRDSITKAVYRVPYDAVCDLVMVFSVPSWRVRTVWLNEKTDTHMSLDASAYEKG